MRAVIADDNRYDRLLLSKMLGQIPKLTVVGEAEDGIELIKLVERLHPSIVFIDIEMPGMSGIEAATEIVNINPQTYIIFVSASESYMKESFDAYAFDYLLKPFAFERLQRTIQRIQGFFSLQEKLPEMAGLDQTESMLFGNQDRLMIQADERIMLLRTAEIIFITRNERKTDIHTTLHIYKSNEPLEKIETKLGSNFFRSHKGFIINTDLITELAHWGNKTYMVKFEKTKETALITADKFRVLKQKYFHE